MSWRTGYFKENSRCVRCGKRLNFVGKICDNCVVEMHVESILTNTPLKQITARYGLYYTAVVHRLSTLKANGTYKKLFFEAVEKYRALV